MLRIPPKMVEIRHLIGFSLKNVSSKIEIHQKAIGENTKDDSGIRDAKIPKEKPQEDEIEDERRKKHTKY